MKKATGAEFVQWMPYVLDALRQQGGSAAPRDVYEIVARLARVPDDKRFAKLGGGGLRFPNQVAWARKYLHWEGLISSPKRGLWMLTESGRSRRLSYDEARQIFLKWVAFHAETRAGSKKQPASTDATVDTAPGPEEQYREEVLSLLQAVVPELVDGDRLVELLEEHEFGLRSTKTYEVDQEFIGNYRKNSKAHDDA